MTRNDVEAIVGLNYMVVPEMFEQQRARRPEASAEDLLAMLHERVRSFNTWTLERQAEDSRIRTFLCCDIGTWVETDLLMEEFERGSLLARAGSRCTPDWDAISPPTNE